MSLLCAMGLHNYAWEYDPAASCEQTGYCRRPDCHKMSKRTHHQYGAWEYVSPTDCTQQRICRRNAEHSVKKLRPSHIWGKPLYVHDGDCERIAICERNPAHKRSSVDHIWGAPVREAHCVMKKYCQRCPSGVAMLGIQHDFLPTEMVNGRKIRRCRHCSHREVVTDR